MHYSSAYWNSLWLFPLFKKRKRKKHATEMWWRYDLPLFRHRPLALVNKRLLSPTRFSLIDTWEKPNRTENDSEGGGGPSFHSTEGEKRLADELMLSSPTDLAEPMSHAIITEHSDTSFKCTSSLTVLQLNAYLHMMLHTVSVF